MDTFVLYSGIILFRRHPNHIENTKVQALFAPYGRGSYRTGDQFLLEYKLPLEIGAM